MSEPLHHSEDYFVKVLLQKAKVSEIMASPVISILADAPFSEVEEKFRFNRIRHLPVVEKDGQLCGIITQRDLYRIVSPRRLEDGGWYYDREMLNQVILRQVMTLEPATISPETSVGEALLKMVNGKYGCLPVTGDKNKLCGIITQLDILKIAAKILKEG